MLHIIWGIIKIIGIILLVLLLCILVILAAVLLVPVRYQGQINKNESEAYVYARISWLFHFIHATVRYKKDELVWDARILGISVKSVSAWLARRNEKKNEKQVHETSKVNELLEAKSEKKSEVKTEEELEKETIDRNADADKETASEEPVREKEEKPSFIKKIKDKAASVKEKVYNLIEKIHNLRQKAEELKTFLKSDACKETLLLVKKELWKLVRHILPRKIKGYVRFGFEDPSSTGQTLGVISMVYPLYHKSLQIYPVFDDKVLEADCMIKGRIILGKLLVIGLRLYFNKNMKATIRHFTK